MDKIDEIPDEELLGQLAECSAEGFNTSCFEEGVCMFPGSKGCARKERE